MPTPSFELRPALPAERDAVRALTLAAYGEYAAVMTPTAWAGLDEAVRVALDADGPAERIVAVRDGTIVGSVMLFPPATDAYGGLAAHAPWPELRLLAVAPDARGLGVGQALVEECARRARAAGATALGLHSSRSMAAAIRMYARLGFVREPAYDFLPEGGEVVEGYVLELRER